MRINRFALLSLLVPSLAGANGFVLNDHGASTTGRANAVAATIDNGSAIVYNPAGLAIRDGINIYAGGSLIVPDSSFTSDRTGRTVDNEAPVAVTPSLYVHSKFADLVAVGLGLHTPFASSIVWPETSPGREELREQALRAFYIDMVVAFDLGRYVPGLSIGGGLDLVPATVYLSRDILFGSDIGTAELGGSAFGIGGRAGIMYRPEALPQLSLGASWRSEVQLDFEGTGDFDIAPPNRASLPPDGDIATSITLPQVAVVGAAYRPIPELELEVDLQWIGWSAFDELVVELPDGQETVSARDYEDTLTIRAGVEYAFEEQGFDLRGGYAYDPTPVPADRLTINLPDFDRHVATLGGSYQLPRNMWVDLGLLWVIPGERRTSDQPNEPILKGRYEVTAFVASLSFGVSFGGKAAQPTIGNKTIARRQR